MLDVGDVTTVADYFVIASGESSTQIRAIGDSVRQTLREQSGTTPRREGNAGANWVLLDYGDVVVHIFRPAERDYYDLERLWADARPVDWEQSADRPASIHSSGSKGPIGDSE